MNSLLKRSAHASADLGLDDGIRVHDKTSGEDHSLSTLRKKFEVTVFVHECPAGVVRLEIYEHCIPRERILLKKFWTAHRIQDPATYVQLKEMLWSVCDGRRAT